MFVQVALKNLLYKSELQILCKNHSYFLLNPWNIAKAEASSDVACVEDALGAKAELLLVLPLPPPFFLFHATEPFQPTEANVA